MDMPAIMPKPLAQQIPQMIDHYGAPLVLHAVLAKLRAGPLIDASPAAKEAVKAAVAILEPAVAEAIEKWP